jgi:hypothetical protein
VQAFDRHFLGLRILAMGSGMQPAIFSDPVYARSQKWLLSTSTVRTTEVGLAWGCAEWLG